MDAYKSICTYSDWSPEQGFALFFALLLPLVLVGVVLWRRGGSRDAGDVLKLGPPGQAERETHSN